MSLTLVNYRKKIILMKGAQVPKRYYILKNLVPIREHMGHDIKPFQWFNTCVCLYGLANIKCL